MARRLSCTSASLWHAAFARGSTGFCRRLRTDLDGAQNPTAAKNCTHESAPSALSSCSSFYRFWTRRLDDAGSLEGTWNGNGPQPLRSRRVGVMTSESVEGFYFSSNFACAAALRCGHPSCAAPTTLAARFAQADRDRLLATRNPLARRQSAAPVLAARASRDRLFSGAFLRIGPRSTSGRRSVNRIASSVESFPAAAWSSITRITPADFFVHPSSGVRSPCSDRLPPMVAVRMISPNSPLPLKAVRMAERS